MLDAKINAEQEMELLSEEAAVVENKRAHNREELLRLQIKYSQLQSQKEKQKTELNKLTNSTPLVFKGQSGTLVSEIGT
jgi:hypothetical protein